MLFDRPWVLDVCFSIVVFVVGVGGVCLPRLIYGNGKRVNSWGLMIFHLGNAMSGGVMLGGGLCHLIPDAIEALGPHTYPIALCLSGLGYLLTLLMEIVAMKIASLAGNRHHHHHHYQHVGGEIVENHVHMEEDLYFDAAHTDHIHCWTERSGNDAYMPIFGPSDEALISAESPVISERFDRQEKKAKFITSLILGIALSYHSVLSGMAVGSQRTVKTSLNIMCAILAHKGMESYALGSSLASSQASRTKFWLMSILYSLALPLGILLGYFLVKSANETAEGILCALSAGTFLFVGIGEIITTEMGDPSHQFKKLFSIFVGFTFMALLPLFE